MWQSMVDQQFRLLSALDRWIERLERAHEDRTAAGIKAGEAVRAQADQALLASIGRQRGNGARARPGRGRRRHATPSAGWSPRAAGIKLAEPSGSGAVTSASNPVERIALALPGPHPGGTARRALVAGEHAGPLVGHRAGSGAPVALLWRRGGYEAVDCRLADAAPGSSADSARSSSRAP